MAKIIILNTKEYIINWEKYLRVTLQLFSLKYKIFQNTYE